MTDKNYFFSATNPIANRDQCEAEVQALRLFDSPALLAGRAKAAFLWKLAYGENASEQAWQSFDQAMAEWSFNYLLKAVASDGNYPKPVRLFMPPHTWFGRDIPGARMGGENPDNCYRVIGIYPNTRYEIHGYPVGVAPASTTFTLVANYGTSKTIQTIDYDELQRDSNGAFTLVIDDKPASGRANHLHSSPEVKFLFIRDTFQDWAAETPLALRVARIDAPDAPPLSDLQVAERAVNAMVDDVPLYYWFTRLFSGKPVNTFPSPTPAGALGGLVTQAGNQGWFQLEDEDAWVIRFDSAGASYCGLVAHDWWFRSIDCWRTNASLTTAMMKPDGDGKYTAVLSLRDPGVHNWIDPDGLREILLLGRWQGLPPGAPTPVVETRRVDFADLAAALPAGTVFVTAQQRQQQIEQRAANFALRLVEQ